MGDTVVRTLLYALVAAASPMALTATLVVLRSSRARLNGIIFATAFLLGSLVVMVAILAIGAVGPSDEVQSAFAAGLELLLGILLLAAALRMRHGRPPRRTEVHERTQAVLVRLGRLNPAGALSIGAALGIGGPKRLTVTIVAATTISAAGPTTAQAVRLTVLYVVVASVLVWCPVAVYLVAGERASEWLGAAEDWLEAHRRAVAMALLLVFGGALVGDALAELL